VDRLSHKSLTNSLVRKINVRSPTQHQT